MKKLFAMIEKSMNYKTSTLFPLVFLFMSGQPLLAAPSNFNFWSNSGDSKNVNGVIVTVSGSNIQKFGQNSIRDPAGPIDAIVKFTFNKPVESFRVNVSRVAPFESIGSFSHQPTSVSGNLLLSSSIAKGKNPGDHNSGTLFWNGVNTNQISFKIANHKEAAIAVDSFALRTCSNVKSNFNFWKKNGDAITINNITTTLSGTNLEKFGPNSVRDPAGQLDSQITLSFSKPVQDFQARFSRVAPFESIGSFSHQPTSVSGNLLLSSSIARGKNPGDHNSGTLFWSGVHTNQISFKIANHKEAAIAFDGFSFKSCTSF